jgi:HD-like signal output (HDOD) protein
MDQESLNRLNQQLEKVIESKSLQLPMLPQVTTEVMALVNDEDSDAASLANLIQSDQALAGHVMRIANSAAYSPTAKLSSLQQAIARLGMQNITEISMAASMGPKLFQTPGFDELIKSLWGFSLATATWAREIAREGRRNVESAFLSGLLFQIGKPVVLQAALKITDAMGVEPSTDEMEQVMKSYQVKVGCLLAREWHLPQSVLHTIQGVDSEAEITDSKDIVETVRAAREFANITMGDRNYADADLATNPLIIDVNLYAEDVDKLLAKTDSIHGTIEALIL